MNKKYTYQITLFTRNYNKQVAILETKDIKNLLKLLDIWLLNGYNVDIKTLVEL